ncbi:MAG: hypothetical protein ABWZ30_00925 [Jiangellaceae bacterium]
MATATNTERLIDVYRDAMVALDAFEVQRARYRGIHAGPSRIDLMRDAGGHITITHLYTRPPARRRGCASVCLRAVTDFADVVGWTISAYPLRVLGGLDEVRGCEFFGRFGFRQLRSTSPRSEPGDQAVLRLPS